MVRRGTNTREMFTPEEQEPICTPSDPWLAFWAQYPRHRAKLDAQRAWKQLKPTAALIVTIMAALERQKAQPNWRQDKSYIPYPASWLRGRRWEDELESTVQPTAKSEHWSVFCAHLPKCEKWIWHEMRLEKEKLGR